MNHTPPLLLRNGRPTKPEAVGARSLPLDCGPLLTFVLINCSASGKRKPLASVLRSVPFRSVRLSTHSRTEPEANFATLMCALASNLISSARRLGAEIWAELLSFSGQINSTKQRIQSDCFRERASEQREHFSVCLKPSLRAAECETSESQVASLTLLLARSLAWTSLGPLKCVRRMRSLARNGASARKSLGTLALIAALVK